MQASQVNLLIANRFYLVLQYDISNFVTFRMPVKEGEGTPSGNSFISVTKFLNNVQSEFSQKS
jgi:hypothetical protein